VRVVVDIGPATVRMVSSNGPPLPMPMQVPPGHMVQQIIDENGILTNVILSSQPPGIMAPPLMVGYYVSIASSLCACYSWDLTSIRRAFDCLTKVIKVTLT